jgi:hypothetical protein
MINMCDDGYISDFTLSHVVNPFETLIKKRAHHYSIPPELARK